MSWTRGTAWLLRLLSSSRWIHIQTNRETQRDTSVYSGTSPASQQQKILCCSSRAFRKSFVAFDYSCESWEREGKSAEKEEELNSTRRRIVIRISELDLTSSVSGNDNKSSAPFALSPFIPRTKAEKKKNNNTKHFPNGISFCAQLKLFPFPWPKRRSLSGMVGWLSQFLTMSFKPQPSEL